MQKVFQLSLFVLLAASLSACTTSGDSSANSPNFGQLMSETTGQNGRACIRTRDIRGYGAENDKQININTMSKYYIATTLYSCHNLTMAPRALFESRFTEACGGTSYITTREGRCPIDKIFEFDNREQAFAAAKLVNDKLAQSKE
ncbi:DUF6491 family protein [Agaribacterium sp. ZY112]|uniref:DUF6491 family protein n=1 Tax=Agaribacterium sp. ZY112 TaxID=3233574 RepID=UPI0035236929